MKVIFLLLTVFGHAAFGANDGDIELLRKLSFRSKGVPPTLLERRELESKKTPEERKQFLNSKIDEYVGSKELTDLLVTKLNEQFQFKVCRDCSYHLFSETISKNLPWDNLLTSKKVYYSEDFNDQAKTYFLTSKIKKTQDENIYEGDKEDPNFAGMITSLFFNYRYADNPTNKGRRRAAAIYRTFMCDSMELGLEPLEKITKDQLTKFFSLEKLSELNDELNASQLDRMHGSEQACAKCHVKLDPLADGLRTMVNSLPTGPASGSLNLYRRSQDKVIVEEHPFETLGALAKIIISLPEYRACQVSNFVRWFWGNDIPVTSKKQLELEKKFDQLERRPRDFIKFLLSQEEFLQPPKNLFMREAQEALNILQQCDTCHQTPSFGVWPIETSQNDPAAWIKEIAKRIDLKNKGVDSTMPPTFSGWQLSLEEIELLRSWVTHGARDLEGKAVLKKEQINEILGH